MAFGDLLGTFVVGTTSVTNPLTATGSATVRVGDLVVVCTIEAAALTNTAVSDNLGNTYTAQNAGSLTTLAGRAWYSRVSVAGSLTSVSGTFTASSDDAVVVAAAFSGGVAGFKVSPLDASPTNGTGDSTTPFTCPASGTLAQPNELVVGWAAVVRGQTNTAATAPFTLAVNQPSSTANAAASGYGAINYQVVAATTTQTPEFSNASGTFTNSILGTMSFMQASMPEEQYDWPVPPGARRLRIDEEQPTNLGLLTTTGTKPFLLTEWPNPPGPRRLNPDYNQPTDLGLLTTTGTKPFLQLSWPNPAGPNRLKPDYQQVTNLVLNVTASPFVQTNWPNPKGYAPRQDYEQSTNLGLLTTTGTKPFLQTAWPNPAPRPTYRLVADPPNITFNLIPPFFQTNWPVPKGYAPRPDYKQATNLGLLTTTGTKPFLLTEWPVPKGHPPRQSYAQPTDLVLLTTTGIKPFLQLTWPNPSRQIARQDYQAYVNLPLTVIAVRPFTQNVWLNPQQRQANTNLFSAASGGVIPPTPPIPGTVQNIAPFMANLGRMMNR